MMVEMNYTHGQVEVFRDDMLWCLPVNRTVAEHITEALEDQREMDWDLAA